MCITKTSAVVQLSSGPLDKFACAAGRGSSPGTKYGKACIPGVRSGALSNGVIGVIEQASATGWV
jgi:hypothetical protein